MNMISPPPFSHDRHTLDFEEWSAMTALLEFGTPVRADTLAKLVDLLHEDSNVISETPIRIDLVAAAVGKRHELVRFLLALKQSQKKI